MRKIKDYKLEEESKLEFILGIGHISLEDCEQVLNRTKKSILELTTAKNSVDKEIKMLQTIVFQVLNRRNELQKQAGDTKEN